MRDSNPTRRDLPVRRVSILVSVFAMLAAVLTLAPVGAPDVSAQIDVGGIPDPTACYGVADSAGAGSADGLSIINRDGSAPINVGLTGTVNIEAVAFGPGAIIDPSLGQQVLYAFDQNTFGYINLTTGAFVPLQPLPALTDVDGMTWDAALGVFWLTDRVGGPDGLAAWDPFTNTFVVGPVNSGVSTDPTFVTPAGVLYSDFDDIAVDPVTGTLYAILNEGGVGGGLVTIDKATGQVASYISLFNPTNQDFDGDGIIDDMEGLAFFNDGQLYGSTGANGPGLDINRFYLIDPATGDTTWLGDFSDFADYEGLACLTVGAGIDLEKGTAEPGGVPDDADTPTGPTISTGTVEWTYVFTNTSVTTPLTNIVLSDVPEGELFNQNTGATRCAEGVLLAPGAQLAPGASLTCTVTGTTQSGQYMNEATVTADGDPGNGLPLIPVFDIDPSHYFGDPPPAILEVVKTVVVGDPVDCSTVTPEPDLDIEPVAVGDTVTYCIVVTNTGAGVATNVVVTDDNFTPNDPADDVIVIASTTLNPGESAAGTFTYVVVDQSDLDNTVTATGTDEGGNPLSPDSDPSGIRPAQGNAELAVVKTAVPGAGVDCATVTPEPDLDIEPVAVGAVVTFCVTVTNVGTGPATNVTVTDDNFTPNDPADDFVVVGPVDLVAGESATGSFEYTTTSPGQVENEVVATGTDANTGNPTNEPTDPAGVVSTGAPVIEVVKTVVVGDPVDCATVTPEPGDDLEPVAVGDVVTFCVTVSNTGSTPATAVTVTDDNFTPADPADDFVVVGPVDLDPGASATGSFTFTVTDLGEMENTVTAIGTDPATGDPTNEPTDPSSVEGVGTPLIGVVKTVVVGDPVDCSTVTPEPGDDLEAVAPGDTVTFCVVVTNTGTGPATAVTVTDDNFTPADPADDFVVVGPVDLDPGASATGSFTFTVTEPGELENTVSATGTDPATGTPTNEPSDPSSVESTGTPELAVVKTVVVGDPVDCATVTPAPGDDLQQVQLGDTVTFCVVVTNTGTGPAVDVTVTDDNFTPADPADDFVVIAPVDLDPGDTAIGSFTFIVTDLGELENTVSATGTDPATGDPTNEPSDPSSVEGIGTPELAVVKTVVVGDPVDCATVTPEAGDDTEPVEVGDAVTYCIVVTNIGNGPAVDVTVVDDNFTPADPADDVVVIGPVDLDPGASATGSFTFTIAELGESENTVTATGTDPVTGDPTNEPEDPASVVPFGTPILEVIKTAVVGDPVDCAAVNAEVGLDTVNVAIGDTVTFCVTVTNSGTGPAVDVTVTDDNFTPADPTDDFVVVGPVDLDPGASATGSFTYVVTNQDELDNTVTAAGTDPETGGPTNEPEDPSGIRPPQGNAELTVVKTAVVGDPVDCATVTPELGDDIELVDVGDTVTYCIVVTNIGGGPAADVVVTDDNFTPADPADDVVVIGPVDLGPGESAIGSFTYTVTSLDELENTVTATGTDVNTGDPTNEPTDMSSIDPVGTPELTVVKTAVLGDAVDCSLVTPAAGLDLVNVALGETVTFCVTVANIGTGPAVDVQVIDDNFTPANQGDDVVIIGPIDLGPGESATGSFTHVVTSQDELDNTVRAIGTDPETGDPTNEPEDDAGIRPPQGNSELAVVKTAVIGGPEACDVVAPAPGNDAVTAEIGDFVTFCIVVTNIGTGPAADVVVTDDNFTPAVPGDDTVVIGPVDLAPGESATGTITIEVTSLDAMTNTVTATGTDVNSGDPTNEPDDEASIVPFGTPILSIVKTAVAGDDVDCSTVTPEAGLDIVAAVAGDTITYCFVVTNVGTGPAVDVTVTDDSFTPNDPSDDVVVIGPVDLDPGESVSDGLSFVVIDPIGRTNIATAAGTDPVTGDPTNTPFDPAGEIVPALELTKQVLRGADADCSTAVEGVDELVVGATGDDVTWCFTVTNVGSTHLVIDEISDAVLGIVLPIDAADQLFAPGDSLTLAANGTISNDGMVNVATTTAQPTGPNGLVLPGVDPLEASNEAVEAPASIELTKQILAGSNRDCSLATEGVNELVVGAPGDAITWCFTVTNTGQSPLAEVVFSDLPVDLIEVDVLEIAGVPALLPGESVTFAAGDTIPEGGFTNTATVVAVPSDPEGVTGVGGFVGAPTLNDGNDAVNLSTGIDLQKTVALGENADCATSVEEVAGNPGDPVTWCFTVTNTGSVTLLITEVEDDVIGVTVPVPEDQQLLAPGESFTVSTGGEILDAELENTAEVTGVPVDDNGDPIIDPETGLPVAPVGDDDISKDRPLLADLRIEKSNGLDAGASAPAGTEIDYALTVTNLGPDPAIDVVVVDELPTGLTAIEVEVTDKWACVIADDGRTVTCETDELAVDEVVELTYLAKIGNDAPQGGDLVNTVKVTSTTTDPTPENNVADDRVKVPVPTVLRPPPVDRQATLPTFVPPAKRTTTSTPTPPSRQTVLALTGVDSDLLTAMAAGMVALGSGLVIVSRRRREDQ